MPKALPEPGGMAAGSSPAHVDADFAAEVLEDLYAYRRKRRWVAFLLWGTLGLLGAHRFYLERQGTALLMLLTGGGFLIWWVVDAFRISGMVRAHNGEQERREREGLPPLELSFMPPLTRDVLARPPAWTETWGGGSPTGRRIRFAGDVVVLVVVGFLLGAVARSAEVWEAVVAVLVLAGLTALGAGARHLHRVPLGRGLARWSHRLRLFYYYNKPGSPLSLLLRPVTGAFSAPFRRRDRAEVKLYLQLGGIFTLFFLLLDFGAEVIRPLLVPGQAVPELSDVLDLWIEEASVTFVVIYCFATPIGAVLTLYLLTRRTHTLPRILSVLTLVAIALGLAA